MTLRVLMFKADPTLPRYGTDLVQPGAPEWLKAGAEYEIAELYAELNETNNAVFRVNRKPALIGRAYPSRDDPVRHLL